MWEGLLLLIAASARLLLIHVHGPDGVQEIEVNVMEISSIRQVREGAEGHFAIGTNCVVYMTNGRFVATHEPCIDVIKMITKFGEHKR
jgi:hypothetical protein